jgi:eukaryotic-like serine/threonine-protein kinase
MDANLHVQSILEGMLDSGHTPEEACRDCPELLPLVLKEWRRKLACDAHLEALFAASGPGDQSPADAGLPQIPGHELHEVLGRGGMGVVYKARHLGLNRIVAVKMLLNGAHGSPEARERFLREAEAVAGLRHPNIVQVYDLGDQGGQPYFTMEFIEGGNLAQKLAGTPQPPRHAATLLVTLAEAVESAHRSGILHRDLKPSNVLLTADGTPKVSDFGLARRMEGESGLTWTGTAVGTPGYMAPEQAEARPLAWGPAVDIYALGAIFYELLTGRPPFRAETAAETIRQAISQDPAPPSRLNAKVPRDAETICLKCLNRDPDHRYDGAAALAADLRRFLAGEAIMARPEGRIARLARRIRQRPVLSAGVAAATLFAVTMAAGGLWLISDRAAVARRAEVERVAMERAARQDLWEMVESMHRMAWPEAKGALERAKARLGGHELNDLRSRLTQGERDLEFATRLEAIRLTGHVGSGQGFDPTRSDEAYEEAFRDAGFDEIDHHPEIVAARVGASNIRNALLAAIDSWASRARTPRRRRWAWDVAAVADQDASGWRDRARDPAIWKDEAALFRLIETTPSPEQSLALLLAIELDTEASGEIRVAFLKRVQERHPHDFWVNARLGQLLTYLGKPEQAVGYYQAALAVRPETSMVHSNLGVSLNFAKRPDEAVGHFRQAVALDPGGNTIRENLVTVLWNLGRKDEALIELPAALRLNSGSAGLHTLGGKILESDNREAEALALYRRAVAIDPKALAAQGELRAFLMRQRRENDARVAWERALDEHPSEHEAWYGYAEFCLFQGRVEDYLHARQTLLAKFGGSKNSVIAERTSRACLLRPASGEEMRRVVALAGAVGALDKAIALRFYPFFQFVWGLAEFRQGHFESAISLMRGEASGALGPAPRLVLAMALHQDGRTAEARKMLAEAVLAYDWRNASVRDQDDWICHVLRREAEAMILHDLSSFLGGIYRPRDNDERLALLGVCQFMSRNLAQASLYVDAFDADPQLGNEMTTDQRYRAACAAALAGCGHGEDVANLDEKERTRWREKAHGWLRLDLTAWGLKLDRGDAKDRQLVRQALTAWRSNSDLAGIREPAALEELPSEERKGWLVFWKEVKSLLERANRE